MVKKTLKKLDKKLSKLQKLERLLKLKGKIKDKPVLKKTKEAVLTIKQREPTSILADPNRFFKDEWDETKKTMFK